MKEIACNQLEVFFVELEKKGMPATALTRDTGCTLEHLRNRHERMDWSSYATFMRNARSIWTEEEIVEIGRKMMASKAVWAVTLVARLLFSPKSFYKWLTVERPQSDREFACIRVQYTDMGPNSVRLEFTMLDGYEVSEEWCWFARGAFSEMPRTLGFERAQLQEQRTPHGTIFDITLGDERGLVPRIVRFVMRPFAALSAARELKEAHALLSRRYHQLDEARKVQERLRQQVEIAYRISRMIHSDLDLESTIAAMSTALLDVAGFVGIEMLIHTDIDGQVIARHTYSGNYPRPTPDHVCQLSVGSDTFGELRVWSSAEMSREDWEKRLEYVVPSVAMALHDAILFTALKNYRKNLESIVAQRTEELERTRINLLQSVDELQAAQGVRDRIFANINHEIRTPLSLIIVMTSLLKKQRDEGAEADDNVTQYVDNIERNARLLLNLVDGLLLLAARQEGKLVLKRRIVDLPRLVNQIIGMWQSAASEAGLSLSYHGIASGSANVDELAMQRVLTNLISNATKFTPRGGRIDVSMQIDGGEYVLSVRDTGVGIPDEYKSKIFGRFEQAPTRALNGQSGSGIGLAIVSELVQAHGGSIMFESTVGIGTEFRMRFPREEVEAQAEHLQLAPVVTSLAPISQPTYEKVDAQIATAALAAQAAKTSDHIILVAEDNRELLAAIKSLLSEDFLVLTATDGQSALELAKKHLPHMLITDVGLPFMDGLELTRQFRQMEGNRLAPVLILTAFGNIDNRVSSFEAGATDYLAKPFDPQELVARVKAHLSVRSLALRLVETEKRASFGFVSAGLAHEIRNPLNGIVNAIGPLKRALPNDLIAPETPVGELLSVLDDCTGQLIGLARNILAVSKDLPIEQKPETLSSIFRTVSASLTQFLDPVSLQVDFSFDGPFVCNRNLMVQMLCNLVKNAAQAAGAGGQVGLVSRLEGETVVVDITDSGPGIPSELHERIFEPFFTTKAPGEGTGLGLTMVRTFAAHHGGSLSVVNVPAGGFFRLRLPLHGAGPERRHELPSSVKATMAKPMLPAQPN